MIYLYLKSNKQLKSIYDDFKEHLNTSKFQ